MGVFVWFMGQDIAGDSYLIVLLVLGIGMGIVLIPLFIVYIFLRKKEKSQEKDVNPDTCQATEEEPSIDQAISALSKSFGIPSSPKMDPAERACEYCGYEPVTEGKTCEKCGKYAIIRYKTK